MLSKDLGDSEGQGQMTKEMDLPVLQCAHRPKLSAPGMCSFPSVPWRTLGSTKGEKMAVS